MRILEDDITKVMDQITETVATLEKHVSNNPRIKDDPTLYMMYVSIQDKLLAVYCEVAYLWGRT